jgi:hypothetical protein
MPFQSPCLLLIRYLTKLCDQTKCLISDEDSANLVWKEDTTQMDNDDEAEESFESYDRVFAFSVQQTNEEEETATVKPGFIVCLFCDSSSNTHLFKVITSFSCICVTTATEISV